jgi:hypothetical protein
MYGTVKEIIEQLQNYDQDKLIGFKIWSEEDVTETFSKMKREGYVSDAELSREDVADVLCLFTDKDCTEYDWQEIEDFIHDRLEGKWLDEPCYDEGLELDEG